MKGTHMMMMMMTNMMMMMIKIIVTREIRALNRNSSVLDIQSYDYCCSHCKFVFLFVNELKTV